MVTLYVCSSEPYSGKALISLALGLRMQQEGRRVGYFKPLGLTPTRVDDALVDADALYIAQTLGVADAVADVSPVVLTHELLNEVVAGRGPNLRALVETAFSRVRRDKDVLIVGGAGSATSTGRALGLPAPEVARMTGAKTLLVGRYENDRDLDPILAAAQVMGEGVIGLILNGVPRSQLPAVRERVAPGVAARGLEVLGVMPRDAILHALSVRTLAEELGARVLCCEEHLDDLVEHFTVGAMSVDSALRYFRRIPNKAVITGGDRSDIQLAALDTDTRCLILTGDLEPNSRILTRAEEAGVPMLLVPMDTLAVIERVEEMLAKVRVRGPRKLQRAQELLAEYVNYPRLMEKLGAGAVAGQ